MIKRIIVFNVALLLAHTLNAQHTFKAMIRSDGSKQFLPGTTVSIKGNNRTAIADSAGFVSIPDIPDGKRQLIFSHVGYETKEQMFFFPLVSDTLMEIYLTEEEDQEEEVVVTATRSSRSISDIPTRIETITAGELHEKIVMQPGNIRMLLTESTGIQTQQTSAVSGNASIRIQGLDGRYTMMLKDGFPLYAGFSGGLSILQIPPLDLKRVEVIKGSSSTLYGSGAIAGLINLVTKEPTIKRELSFLANINQTGALDLNAFYSQKFSKIGLTLFATRNSQAAYNNNKDDFSDIPHYVRYTVNPKLFYYINESSTVNIGINSSFENRLGGDMQVIKGKADNIHSYFERNKTNRYSTQLKFEKKFTDKSILTFKNSFGYFNRTIWLPGYLFSGRQYSSFSEISYLFAKERTEWVTGLSFITDKFKQTNTTSFALDYNLQTTGVFIQNNWKPVEKFVLETGLRADYTNQKNFVLLPRVSTMYKFNSHLTSRIGGGFGYKAPNIFSEEAEEKSFRNIQPPVLATTKIERSIGVNFDINFRKRLFDKVNFSVNQLFFYTRLKNPLLLDTLPASSGNYAFFNADGSLHSSGFETNTKFEYRQWSMYLGYTYTNVRRNFRPVRSFNPLTAKHRINFNVMYETEEKWRIAYELFYTGKQQLTNGELVRDYWVMGISGERKFRYFSLFLNFENFLDTRQSRWEPMYTGSLQNPDFREIYTPTDGFIFNGGFRLSL